MKLEINGVAMPYNGGCTVERNYPFFEEGGLENSFSYTFNVPICSLTHDVFGDVERVNSQLPLAAYKVRVSHEEITYVEGDAKLSGVIDDDDFKLNLTDEGESVYGALSNLMLTDLDVAKFTFNNYDDYLTFAKEKTFDNMMNNELFYPLIHCPDFYSNVKGEGEAFDAAMDVWEANPLLNHWQGIYEGDQANKVPDTVLFPVISSSYILKKICEKLGLETLSNQEQYNVVISSYFRGKTPLEVFNSGAYREENGVITVDIADYLPSITALEYFQSIMTHTNMHKPDSFSISKKTLLIRNVNKGPEILPYVLSVEQDFLEEKDGWQISYCDELITSGNGEDELSLSTENVIQVKYRLPDLSDKLWVGSIGLTLGDEDTFQNVFKLNGGYSHGITTIHNIPTDELKEMWSEFLDWKIKRKRQLTVKCTPSRDLLIGTRRLGLCMYKNVLFFIKQIRFEMLESRLGVVTMVIVER